MTKTATPEQARQLYNEIRAYITDAREIAERGEFIELHSLDDRVGELCEQIQHLKIPDAKPLTNDLEKLVQELSDLQELFLEQRELLANEITGVGKHKQAVKAYKNQEATSRAARTTVDDDD